MAENGASVLSEDSQGVCWWEKEGVDGGRQPTNVHSDGRLNLRVTVEDLR